MRDRGYRREAKKKRMDKVRNMIKNIWSYHMMSDEAWVERTVRTLADTRKPCSCTGCGNPRKHYGIKTIQEQKILGKRKKPLVVIEEEEE